jgi:alpha-2-macroglobulin
MLKSRYQVAFLLFLLSTLSWSIAAGLNPALPTGQAGPAKQGPKPPEWNGDFAEGWRQFDSLTEKQQFEAASSLADRMLASARDARNNPEWTRCLIRYTQLRIALHGYETAVRFLKEQPWPDDRMNASLLNLFYAQALVTYAHSYSWEINRREKTESKKAVDLKAWTRHQIYEEAQKAYGFVWQARDRLGELPITEWKQFITENTYPKGIRPTLRDAISYLWVETLADTNGWRPEQLNELYRLNLKRLIEGVTDAISLADPAIHPLEKISFILADLESWHSQKREPEAALEASLERYRQLHSRFTDSDDRKRIQSDLEQRLESLGTLPWWSQGMAQLAEFIRMENEPDSLIRARQIALRGEKAFPESVGGKRCSAIRKDIEAPDYSITGMHSDNPQKKSILVTHKNLPRVFFRAYSIDLFSTIEKSRDYSILPSGRELEKIIEGGAPDIQWEVPLPATPDFRLHKTYVVPPIVKPGAYLIVGSARQGFGKADNKLDGIYITVTDLVLVTRQRNRDLEVTALSGSTGQPADNAEVMLYRLDWNAGHQRVNGIRTDMHGIAKFRLETNNSIYTTVARKGDEIAYDPHPFNSYEQGRQFETSNTLIFTDRSIYRPSQKVFWKAVAYTRKADGIHFETSPGSTITISLRDTNNQIVESKTVTANNFGTASGEFLIPGGRALGSWSLMSSGGGATPIRVEEYKRPTFETKILDPTEPLRLNRPALVKGEARYYFGLPVTSGQVKWLVKREPVFPWWWFYCWRGEDSYSSSSSQIVGSGTAALKEDGTFSFTFSPDVDERLGKNKDISYRYSVSTDVTDEGGETRSAQRSFSLGFVSVQATADFGKEFFLKNDPVTISVVRTTLDGDPKHGKGTWRIVSLKGPAETLLPTQQPLFLAPGVQADTEFQTPGDRERPRWNHGYNVESVLLQWPENGLQSSGDIAHNEKGVGKINAAKLAPGAYRLIYETTDDFGAKYELRKNFLVADASFRLPVPAILALQESFTPVGGKARILVHSGLKNQLVLLEIYRDGRSIRREEIHSGVDPSIIEIPITEADRGGLGVTMTLIRDNQFIHFERPLIVPWDNKELKVEFSTFRDRMRPGQQESWSVKVSGPKGADPAIPAAELLAYMYDRSLDSFVPHTPANPLNLYPMRYSWIPARSNLGQSSQLWIDSNGFSHGWAAPYLRTDQLQVYRGYGIGGVGRGGGVSGSSRRLESATAVGGIMAMDSAQAVPAASAPAQFKEAKARADLADQNELSKSSAGAEPARPVEMRSDFSETAFWKPHLLTNTDGSVTFEFKVPDSVTSWNVWVHAITRDLKSGFVTKEARTVKELMVRPYVPRFLREGDQAELKVVVNNAAEKELKGSLNFDIIDVATDQSVLSQFGISKSDANGKAFTVPAGGGANLSFPITTPSKVGEIAFRVTATSGDFSDGELRPIPILPGRMHLMQSRFVTLKDQPQRIMRFDDLARNDDPTRINEQMVVTLDSQLFYSVLSALPYLVNYPYECTEQTLNRFVSTGIMSSLYQQYPAVERMAKEFSSRQTQLDQWDAPDPNRKMALEETPWLEMAKGGTEKSSDLINVLDSRIAKAQRESALAKLRKMQTSIGGFPWFPGGPPSPYMTLYLLYGFSKALEFGVEVPREIVKPAWNYTHQHYLDEIVRDMMAHDSGWEFVTFINYVLSNYPDASWYENSFTPAERKTMLDFSFKHWNDHSPYLKGYLALTLKRMGRAKDAMLVWASVMDSAKTAEDQGTFWAPEDRSWLWYNDTIETHAFAIRTEMELLPDDPKLDGMVLWIFLNKKLNHWKSTRATAEVVYSLAHYLKKTGQLGVREDATVTVGNRKTTFVFEPDQYTGKKNQIVIPGDKIDPQTGSTVSIEKTGKSFLLASATWHFSTERLPEEAKGDYLTVSRSYFKRVNTGREFTLQPMAEGATLAPGDEVEVHLSLTSKHPMEYVHLRDPRGAGFEPASNLSRYKWDLGISWYEEIRDSGTNFFFEHLPQGEYTFKYRVRATMAGTFKIAPATVQPMYAPEFAAYSSGAVLKIAPAKN